jgi:hypothetical protein
MWFIDDLLRLAYAVDQDYQQNPAPRDLSDHHLKDDIEAAAFYASFGLLDPTNVADIPVHLGRGLTWRQAVGLMAGRALLGGAALGWLIDPKHKREGGWDDHWTYPMTEGAPWYWHDEKRKAKKRSSDFYSDAPAPGF